MESTLGLRFNGCLVTNIEETFQHLQRVYEAVIAPLGLSVLEWYALRALYVQDGVSASHLAQMLCRHPSSLTALLDRMEEHDLLRREVDAGDRRSVCIFLTDAGRALEPAVQASAEKLTALIDSLITPEQLQTFHHVLHALQRASIPPDD
jgi:DNA-binding MarR family transcriptional regulator